MDLLNALELTGPEKLVVSLVGSGGKTTLLYKICDAMRKEGRRTAALTTTHIMRPLNSDGLQCIIDDDVCLAQTYFDDGKVVLAGTQTGTGRLEAPNEDMLTFLMKTADVIVAEADGSRRLPIKFPNDTEPVLLPGTTHLFVVAGLCAIGKPLSEVCHRWPLAMAECGLKGQQSLVTPLMLAQILARGYGVLAPVFVLNQADDEITAEYGRETAEALKKYGCNKTIVLSLEKEKIW